MPEQKSRQAPRTNPATSPPVKKSKPTPPAESKKVAWTLPPPAPLSSRHLSPDAKGRMKFPVHDVKVGPGLQAVDAKIAIAHLTNGKGEVVAMLDVAPCVRECYLGGKNVFANMIHTAFYEHYPIVLNPDQVWIVIAQGLAMHIKQNAETLRDRFVRRQGQKEVVYENLALHIDSPCEDWIAGLNSLVEALVPELGAETVSLFECSFSTTGSLERYVSRIVLLDSMQHYFTYVMRGGCGIPYVAMEGFAADWEAIRSRVQTFRQYDLDWWVDPLTEVLDEFVLAARGRPNAAFWQKCCTKTGMSGVVDPITGWLSVLFPYLRGGERRVAGSIPGRLWPETVYAEPYARNTHLATWKDCSDEAPALNVFPSSTSFAPFEFQDLRDGTATPMLLAGGMAGITQCPETLELRPCLSLAVLRRRAEGDFAGVGE